MTKTGVGPWVTGACGPMMPTSRVNEGLCARSQPGMAGWKACVPATGETGVSGICTSEGGTQDQRPTHPWYQQLQKMQECKCVGTHKGQVGPAGR